jgi:hypothetical protein
MANPACDTRCYVCFLTSNLLGDVSLGDFIPLLVISLLAWSLGDIGVGCGCGAGAYTLDGRENNRDGLNGAGCGERARDTGRGDRLRNAGASALDERVNNRDGLSGCGEARCGRGERDRSAAACAADDTSDLCAAYERVTVDDDEEDEVVSLVGDRAM